MYLQTIPNTRLVASHSGQKRTTKRSATRFSKITRYSCSFVFFVDFPLPDLWVRKRTIDFAAFAGASNPAVYSLSSLVKEDDQPEARHWAEERMYTSRSSWDNNCLLGSELSFCRLTSCCWRFFARRQASTRTSCAEVWTSCSNNADTVRIDRPSRRLDIP